MPTAVSHIASRAAESKAFSLNAGRQAPARRFPASAFRPASAQQTEEAQRDGATAREQGAPVAACPWQKRPGSWRSTLERHAAWINGWTCAFIEAEGGAAGRRAVTMALRLAAVHPMPWWSRSWGQSQGFGQHWFINLVRALLEPEGVWAAVLMPPPGRPERWIAAFKREVWRLAEEAQQEAEAGWSAEFSPGLAAPGRRDGWRLSAWQIGVRMAKAKRRAPPDMDYRAAVLAGWLPAPAHRPEWAERAWSGITVTPDNPDEIEGGE